MSTFQGNKIEQISKWSRSHWVDLNRAMIHFESYSFEKDRKEMAEMFPEYDSILEKSHVQITFTHSCENADTFRKLKRAVGGRISPGEDESGTVLYSPMQIIKYPDYDEPVFIKVLWVGAYTCDTKTTFNCHPVKFYGSEDEDVESASPDAA